MSFCPSIDDVNAYQLAKVMSSPFLYYEVTIFSFEIYINLWGDTLRLYKYHVLH